MIDSLTSLTFAIHSSPGVYALLLGSGISRGAGILTGWEITLDLVRRVAALEGKGVEISPERWFVETYGKEPDYSALLEALGKTRSERSALLRQYFEPTEVEKAQNLKIPSPSHRAVARLVKIGAIRLILTTNFDRLLELALADEGIVGDVISNDDSLSGSQPYVHSQCTIVKLHGDYRDTRIKNTENELAEYSPALNGFLDRVFDEFGIIVCGWSGEWDSALVAAILRSKSRRYTTYWLKRGELGSNAKRIVEQRRAEVITISSSDTFFQAMVDRLTSLKELDQSHPLSRALLAQTVKRYLADDSNRIKLIDLISEESSRAKNQISTDEFTFQELPSRESVQRRAKKYEIATELVIVLCKTLVKYDEGVKYLTKCIEGCETMCPPIGIRTGYPAWSTFQYYPSMLVLYSSCLVALKSRNYSYLVGFLASLQLEDENRTKHPAVSTLNIISTFGELNDFMQPEPGVRRHTPSNDHVWTILRNALKDDFPGEDEFDRYFNSLEYLIGMVYVDTLERDSKEIGAPAARLAWKLQYRVSGGYRIAELEDRKDAFLKAGLFGGSGPRFDSARDKYEGFLKSLRW
jgi:hypothetical protein